VRTCMCAHASVGVHARAQLDQFISARYFNTGTKTFIMFCLAWCASHFRWPNEFNVNAYSFTSICLRA